MSHQVAALKQGESADDPVTPRLTWNRQALAAARKTAPRVISNERLARLEGRVNPYPYALG